jgi:cytochrome c oxidase subunit 2
MGEFFNSISKFFSSLFYSGSDEAYNINNMFLQYMILAGVIILIVAGSITVAAIIYRSKKRPGQPPQIFGNKNLEFTWTVLPLLAVTFFFFLAVRTMSEINAPFNKKSEPDIVIIAHQWWWDIRYPKYDVITANELHIPVGKKLLMRVESADVIHDWWVPKLGRKIDAVPGQLNYNWIEADTAGVYTGTCSEYCGMEHAWMRIMVVAQDKNHFNNWIKNQQKIPEVPVNKPSRTGAILFQKKTCANCHSINGTPADSHIGPDLTHLGSRATLLSGMLKNNRVNLSRWLKNPQKVKEGAHMPNFILSKYEINALVSYLEGLK